MDDIIQLKISLQHSNPPIWRRIQVPKSITFFDLHHVIQIAMGWTNSHLFEFIIHGYTLGWTGDAENENEQSIDANSVVLGLVLNHPDEKFEYIYDFGDWWEHLIEVEALLSKDEKKIYPVCINGELRCPTEDSGGMDGFYRNLEIIRDKNHPEYNDTKTWLGKGYNPKKFDIEKVNKELPNFKKWMKHWKSK